MKKYLFFTFFLLSVIFASAQSKPKPKDKPPTPAEMNEMLKESQRAMDNMSPEDKKMMDSLGFKLPSTKNIPTFSDKQINKVAEDGERIVPQRDAARIAAIANTPTTAAVPAYLKSVHGQVVKNLNPETAKEGEAVYQELKSQYQSASAVGNGAVGSWVLGKQGMALYVMSKACQDDPGDGDNLNNFAAMLTMSGGEQYALPLLMKLDATYPGNSTITSNIGQAWFGLGDMDKASKYIDKALALCPAHTQANLTKARLELNEGNREAAIEAIKRSIKEAYSSEKEDALDKLGYKLKSEDLTWDRPFIRDGLGLNRFKWPAYPKNVVESEVLKPEWELFREKCQAKIAELELQRAKLEKQQAIHYKERMDNLRDASQTGTYASLYPEMAPKAFIKLAPLVKGTEAVNNFVFENELQSVFKARARTVDLEDIETEQKKAIEKKYKDRFGEGKDNPTEPYCNETNAASNEFLIEANTTLEQHSRVYFNYLRSQIDNILYYRLYTQWPDEFELSTVNAQISWLYQISNQEVEFREECKYKKNDKKDSSKAGPLQEFDVVHCNYHSELNLLFGSINVDCSRMTGKIDLSATKLTIRTKQGDRDDENFLDQYQGSSVEYGYKKGVSFGNGPLKMEAKVGFIGHLEFDRKGLSDGWISAGADVKVGTNIITPYEGGDKMSTVNGDGDKVDMDTSVGQFKDPSISIMGTEAKLTMSGGTSVEGKGIFSNVGK